MTQEELKNLTNQVEKIVREVGDWVLSKQMVAKKEVAKEKGDYATDIDLEAEKKLVSALSGLDGSIGFETEEHTNGNDDSGDGLRWVIDPIDGTKNYFRKLPLWNINVALFDGKTKDILIGVVYFPKFKDLFTAYKGGGALRNGVLCQPSTISDPQEAMVYVEPPNISRGMRNEELYKKIRNKVFRVRTWGLATSLCYMADGGFDAFIDICATTKNYDVLAPLIVALEAGCKLEVFDVDKPIEERAIIVTNGKLRIDF